jgi:hypothetical protein
MIPIASHPFETSFAVINDVVFRSADTQATLQAIARDLDLWSHSQIPLSCTQTAAFDVASSCN